MAKRTDKPRKLWPGRKATMASLKRNLYEYTLKWIQGVLGCDRRMAARVVVLLRDSRDYGTLECYETDFLDGCKHGCCEGIRLPPASVKVMRGTCPGCGASPGRLHSGGCAHAHVGYFPVKGKGAGRA